MKYHQFLSVITTDAFAILVCFAVFASCQGCGSASTSYETAAGTVQVTDTYYAGLWSSHQESVVSTPRYRECLEERRALLPVYQSGRTLNWEELSPIQRDCFTQTTPQAAMGSSGGEAFGGANGYAWGGSQSLTITPGIRRKGEDK